MKAPATPRIFLAAARGRVLLALAVWTLAFGAAMLPAMATMADHGASLLDFESAGSVARSQEVLAGWGEAGKAAAWWQLGLDLPFMLGYALFLAGACTAVALRAARLGRRRLLLIASLAAWLGPVAAATDLLQNVGLTFVLLGSEAAPWPRIAALCGPVTTTAAALAALMALIGALATRGGAAGRQSGPTSAPRV